MPFTSDPLGLTNVSARISIKLEQYFKPLGIAAYTNCCRLMCTGTYADDFYFEIREKGIFFIRLHLDGMNFNPLPERCFANYDDFEYLTNHWNEEKILLEKWCSLVGLQIGEFTIIKPLCEKQAVEIKFKKPLNLG